MLLKMFYLETLLKIINLSKNNRDSLTHSSSLLDDWDDLIKEIKSELSLNKLRRGVNQEYSTALKNELEAKYDKLIQGIDCDIIAVRRRGPSRNKQVRGSYIDA